MDNLEILSIVSVMVDGKKVKENTWYKVKSGKLKKIQVNPATYKKQEQKKLNNQTK